MTAHKTDTWNRLGCAATPSVDLPPILRPRVDWRALIVEGIWPSPVKRWIYRRRGYRICESVRIGFGSVLRGVDVDIADGVTIGRWSAIFVKEIRIASRSSIGGHCVIRARRLHMGEAAMITDRVTVTGFDHLDATLTMGANSILMYHAYVDVSRSVTIGRDTGVGGHCLVFTHAAWGPVLDGYPVHFAPVSIEASAWLPWRVFVMPGVKIGEGAVVSAGSVVLGDIPPSTLASGNPARVIARDYPPRLTPDEYATAVRDILSGFVDYLELNDRPVAQDESGLQVTWPAKQRGRAQVLHLLMQNDPHASPRSPASVVIAPNGLATVARHALDCDHVAWFDLKNRERSSQSGVLGGAFEHFVARFGMRFLAVLPFAGQTRACPSIEVPE